MTFSKIFICYCYILNKVLIPHKFQIIRFFERHERVKEERILNWVLWARISVHVILFFLYIIGILQWIKTCQPHKWSYHGISLYNFGGMHFCKFWISHPALRSIRISVTMVMVITWRAPGEWRSLPRTIYEFWSQKSCNNYIRTIK